MSGLTFVILVGTCFRLTRLVTTDSITEPVRTTLRRRFPGRTVPLVDDNGSPQPGTATLRPRWPVVLSACDHCVAPWVALGLVLAAHGAGLVPSWAMVALSWLSVAAGGALVADLQERVTR